MAVDANLELYNAALNTAPNTDVNGSWVNLGRVGLPDGAQFIVGVDNLGGVSADSPVVKFRLQLTLDNNATRKTISEFEVAPNAGFEGKLVREIAQDFNVQEYAGANVDVRLVINPVSGNASNNITADKIYAYLGTGAKQVFGRKSTADTLTT